MKLKLISASKFYQVRGKQNECSITKTGNFRFKKGQIELFSIKEDSKFIIGIDEDEPVVKTVYFFHSHTEEGKKVIYTKGGYLMVISPILRRLEVSFPAKCKIEKAVETIEEIKYEGFKLIFGK